MNGFNNDFYHVLEEVKASPSRPFRKAVFLS